MIWVIIALLIIILMLIIALTRIRITIDSVDEIARLSWGRVLAVELTDVDALPTLRLRVFGWTRDQDVLRMITQRKQPDKSEKRKSKKLGRSAMPSPRRIWRVLRSFRINHFKLALDTNDYIMNAWLWPVIELMRIKGANININFNGINELRMEVSNSPVRMLIAWFK